MMRKLNLSAGMLSILLVAIVCSRSLVAQEPNRTRLDHLKDPRITTMKNRKMLVVKAQGDPNVVGGKAFGFLFQLYSAMNGTPKGPLQAAPRARWPVCLDSPKSEWIGLYGLPVPEAVSALPEHQAQEGFQAILTTWAYGEVAEILHVGSYDKEDSSNQRLLDFVKQQRYVIIGGVEEEYIIGPTMFGQGDPEKFQTIIRYRVQDLRKLVNVE